MSPSAADANVRFWRIGVVQVGHLEEARCRGGVTLRAATPCRRHAKAACLV